MGARKGMVRPTPEQVYYDPGLGPNEFCDLRLWVAKVNRLGGHVAPGYHRISKLGRSVLARKNGQDFGKFTQFACGTYAATGLPKYTCAGHGFVQPLTGETP